MDSITLASLDSHGEAGFPNDMKAKYSFRKSLYSVILERKDWPGRGFPVSKKHE